MIEVKAFVFKALVKLETLRNRGGGEQRQKIKMCYK